MRPAIFSRPRPVPGRRASILAGAGVIVLALPVCLAGRFSVAGWLLAAALWGAAELLGSWLGRIPTGADHLSQSGLVGLGMAFRGIGVMVVLLVVTVANRSLGVTAVVIYALAYTLALAVSLLEYFGGKPD